MRNQSDAGRMIGATGFVSLLEARAQLRLGSEQTRDAVWTLTSPELYDLLVTRRAGPSTRTRPGWPRR